jgi:hypothetical protein
MLPEPQLDRFPQKDPKVIQDSFKYQQGITVCSAVWRGEGEALRLPDLGVNKFNSELRLGAGQTSRLESATTSGANLHWMEFPICEGSIEL